MSDQFTTPDILIPALRHTDNVPVFDYALTVKIVEQLQTEIKRLVQSPEIFREWLTDNGYDNKRQQ